jgi:serine/threonine protein kinase
LHNNVIKLCDFGWAVQSPLSRGTLCGTPIYASPELVLKQQNYDTKIDIWNIGIMTYEFLFGFTPFNIK